VPCEFRRRRARTCARACSTTSGRTKRSWVDKWFNVQATTWLPGTLDRVKKLRRPPCLRREEPEPCACASCTPLRSTNPAQFHAADGSGYQFVAEQVVALDRINPQVASRLARPSTAGRSTTRAGKRTRAPRSSRSAQPRGFREMSGKW
jgi:aminopeptidase N